MTEYYKKVYVKCDVSNCDDGRLPGLRADGKCPNCKGEGYATAYITIREYKVQGWQKDSIYHGNEASSE